MYIYHYFLQKSVNFYIAVIRIQYLQIFNIYFAVMLIHVAITDGIYAGIYAGILFFSHNNISLSLVIISEIVREFGKIIAILTHFKQSLTAD